MSGPVADLRPETLDEYLDQFDGELDGTALLQDLYQSEDAYIPWGLYLLPSPSEKLVGKRVIDTYREYKDEMTDRQVEELYCRLQDERNRRRARKRRTENGKDGESR